MGVILFSVVADVVYTPPISSAAFSPFGPMIVVAPAPADFIVMSPVPVSPRVAAERTLRLLLTLKLAPVTLIFALPLDRLQSSH